ncbi:protein kinase [Streptomyces sp. 3MP-14]|uniref:Protein kinase n=1 Tax=Streptomyces mimosae TaxID=2586635 RepID=A0A5N6AL08_9ACTN|nr:protein kinase [Streptomyces mimosae]KAB8177908.1 protein kinase [Streptomyces sp. 3MP-14]
MRGAEFDGVGRPLGPGDPATVGGYRLIARLGSGGMGRVYLSHTPAGRPVAVKVIRAEFAEDPAFRERFRHEVAAARRVPALCTAPVVDADPDAATPWLATAYVPGTSLADAVGRDGGLPFRPLLLLVAGVAEALGAIHGAGVVHRDLKPANVLLSADGPCVIDFGIARATEATALTRGGLMVGTPTFMAPEQALGRPVVAASDVFSLGQLTVFAATGRPAFGEGTAHGVLYRIVHEQPSLDGVPEPLLPLVERCLAKDPAARPTPAEVIVACQELTPGTDPLTRGPDWLPPTPPTPRRPRRRQLALLGGALAVLLALGALATVLLPHDEGPPAGEEYGPIELPAGDHLFLGEDPVTPRASNAANAHQIDLRYFTGGDEPLLRTAEGNELVRLPADAAPTAESCRAQDSPTEALPLASLTPGDRLCVRTQPGHVALITLTDPDPAPASHITLTLTLWRAP